MSKQLEKLLLSKRIVIVTHEATTGPAHDVRDFLKERSERLLFISHPLLYISSSYQKNSYWELFRHGKHIGRGKAPHYVFPELLLYIKDILYSFVWFITKIGKADIYIGVGNINALVGIFLQKIGRVRTVIFYCIDYVPQRFSSKLVNNIYHWVDKFVVEQASITWNLSSRMEHGRKAKWNTNLPKQITVPIGCWYARIAKNQSKKTNWKEIVYLGTLLEKQGLDLTIEVIDGLRKMFPDVTLTIIGKGPYEEILKRLVAEKNLTKYVNFLGYIENHADVEKRISQGALAVALYNPIKDSFSYYADPGKVKNYLACGVPVLITDIPYVAQQVDRAKCGIIVKYKKEDIIKEITTFFFDEKKIQEYKKNAQLFARDYDWPIIISKALQKTFYGN